MTKSLPMIDWFVGAVVYRFKEQHLEFLLQNSETLIRKYSWQGVQTKFPGGTQNQEDGDFFATLRREISEELGLHLKEDVKLEVIYDVIKGLHRKIFYLIPFEALQGELRAEEILDGTSRLFRPDWVRVDVNLYKKIYYTHRPALGKAVQRLNLKKKQALVE